MSVTGGSRDDVRKAVTVTKFYFDSTAIDRAIRQFDDIRNEKALRGDANTARAAGCSKAEPKIFAPPQIPFPGARDGQNLISWRWSLPEQTQFGEDRCTQFRVIVHGNRLTHKRARPSAHGRRKRGVCRGSDTPTIYVEGILICISP